MNLLTRVNSAAPRSPGSLISRDICPPARHRLGLKLTYFSISLGAPLGRSSSTLLRTGFFWGAEKQFLREKKNLVWNKSYHQRCLGRKSIDTVWSFCSLILNTCPLLCFFFRLLPLFTRTIESVYQCSTPVCCVTVHSGSLSADSMWLHMLDMLDMWRHARPQSSSHARHARSHMLTGAASEVSKQGCLQKVFIGQPDWDYW